METNQFCQQSARAYNAARRRWRRRGILMEVTAEQWGTQAAFVASTRDGYDAQALAILPASHSSAKDTHTHSMLHICFTSLSLSQNHNVILKGAYISKLPAHG